MGKEAGNSGNSNYFVCFRYFRNYDQSIMKPAILTLVFIFSIIISTSAQTFDLIIRNGMIMDGTGNSWYRGDIGISDDVIMRVGNLEDFRGEEEIDATNLMVCPGFIDIHSHADGPLGHLLGIRSEKPKLRAAHNMVMQGVTTLVVNHDGRSPLSIRAQRMQLEKQGHGPNVILMVGHNSIRAVAMDNDYERLASGSELKEMITAINEGIDAGAFGLTAGLEYVPGRWSNTEEMVALVGSLKEKGGVYIVHERASGTDPMWYLPSQEYNIEPETMLDNIHEVVEIAEKTGVPTCATHIKVRGADYWGISPAMIRLISEARSRGVDVWADQYPYNSTGSDGNTMLIPSWALDFERWQAPQYQTSTESTKPNYAEILQKVLSDPAMKVKFDMDVTREIERRGGLDNIRVFDFPKESLVGKSIREIAIEKELSPIDVAIYLQIEGYADRPGGARLRGFSLNEMDIRNFAAEEWMITASDAGVSLPELGSVHARFYGTFPRKIKKYAMDEKVISVEHAVRSMTSLPAQFMGLKDRGLLREGYKADLVLLNMKTLQDHATFVDPHQYPTGVSKR